MKKFFLIFIMLLVTFNVFPSGQRSAESAAGSGSIPEYINLDGYLPVVKQGTNISMTFSWLPDNTWTLHSDPSQIWWFEFVKKAMNINLVVTARAQGPETKNLMFASGDLPDIWMDGLNTYDIVNYGMGEKLIMPITDYINPKLMPLLNGIYNDDPGLKGPSTAPDGNMYGFPNLRGKEQLIGPITGGLARSFFNKKMLDQVGLQVPQTLDQYLEVLRAFKKLDANILPDTGIFNGQNNFCLVYSALGFHWTNFNSTNPSSMTFVGTRNGEITFIYGDKQIFPKFVETYATMYREGLISPDFFTMNTSAQTAITMEGRGGTLYGGLTPFVGPELTYDYVSAKPLTSEFNNTLFWVGPNNLVMPNVAVLTSKNKYPEAAARMFDYGYDPSNYVLISEGFPDKMPDFLYGMGNGWTIKNNVLQQLIDNTQLYPDQSYYVINRIRPSNNPPGLFMNRDSYAMKLYGLIPPKDEFNLSLPDHWARSETYNNLSLYSVTEFPFTVYWEDAISRRLNDLSTVINDYVAIQFAQFVTGARPLSDLPKYFDELDKLNYQEYLKYYSDYYAKVRTDR
ncbi:MAG: hypothetical protein FWD78_03630 [Treponema sp.]|nr:hypothetical protein [Treponema sp.]